jgi:hypothetical protein
VRAAGRSVSSGWSMISRKTKDTSLKTEDDRTSVYLCKYEADSMNVMTNKSFVSGKLLTNRPRFSYSVMYLHISPG